jgi:hypothetical protein
VNLDGLWSLQPRSFIKIWSAVADESGDGRRCPIAVGPDALRAPSSANLWLVVAATTLIYQYLVNGRWRADRDDRRRQFGHITSRAGRP